MYWSYGGFVAAMYAALSIWAAWKLPTHDNPELGALAFFVLIPLFVIGVSGGILSAVPKKDKAALDQGFLNGAMTRPYAFLVGFLTGMFTCAGIASFWYMVFALFNPQSWGFLIAIIVVLGVLAISPAVAASWLIEKCRSHKVGVEEIARSDSRTAGRD